MTAKRKKIYDALLAAKMRKPFVPFVIRRKNGKRYEINNRWHVAFSKTNPRIVVTTDGRSHDFFDWPEVAEVEVHEPTA
jgi:hypothetical protein